MAPHHAAPIRLLALCLTTAAQSAAFVGVAFQSLQLVRADELGQYQPDVLAGCLVICAVPVLLAAPLLGPLAGSRWYRVFLIGPPALATATLAWANLSGDVPWLSLLGLMAFTGGTFGCTALAILPPLAAAARWRLPSACAALSAFTALGIWLTVDRVLREGNSVLHEALIATVVAVLSSTLVITVRADGPPTASMAKTLLAGARAISRSRRGRSALLGLCVWAFATLTVLVTLAYLSANPGRPSSGIREAILRFLPATILGITLSAFNRHPYRHAGFLLIAVIIAFIAAAGQRLGGARETTLPALGVASGLSGSPLLSFYLTWTDSRQRGVAAALAIAGLALGALATSMLLLQLENDPVTAREDCWNVLLVVLGVAAVGGIGSFFRPAMELIAEVLLGPNYRIRSYGPGAAQLPVRGPCLVIANHAAWLDPLFLAKVLPAPIVPMMSSKFYDLPILSWWMRHVIGTIRVPDRTIRHDAPELNDAVAALDRGDYVILFPEGYLRRKQDVPLRRFGRGVWQILRDRPNTPLFACWIEGNWGSYLSWKDGPPAKGKRIDFWRPIRIGVLGPIRVEPAMLADHMTTRTYLMHQMSEARRVLGFGPLALPAVHDAEENE